MKNKISRIASLVLVSTFLLSSQVFAGTQCCQSDEKDKLVIKTEVPLISVIADVFEITVTYAENEFSLVFSESLLEILGITEDSESLQLESWMFSELITEEESAPLEDWMYAENYYSEEYENSLIEDWMMKEL